MRGEPEEGVSKNKLRDDDRVEVSGTDPAWRKRLGACGLKCIHLDVGGVGGYMHEDIRLQMFCPLGVPCSAPSVLHIS